MKNTKLLVSIAILAIFGGGLFYYLNSAKTGLSSLVGGIYTSDKYGFQIEIPKDWTIPNFPDKGHSLTGYNVIDFNSPETTKNIGQVPGPVFDIRFIPSESLIEDKMKEEPEMKEFIFDLKKKTINNLEFTTYFDRGSQCDLYVYETLYNDLAYRFDTCEESKIPILEKMLSTLKFTK